MPFAKHFGRTAAVVLSDSADATTSGAGDSNHVLREL